MVNESSLSHPAGIQDSTNRLYVLMGLLSQNQRQSDLVRIKNNLIHAALHIYAFDMGLFPQGTLPNLPGEHGQMNMYVIHIVYISADSSVCQANF